MERPPLDAESLSAEEVAALKDRERAGRDAGARRYLEHVATRGAFRVRAEDLTLMRHLDPRPDEEVLDAGAGVGRHALAIAARARRVVALDFSAAALEVLREEAARRGLAHLAVRAGDVAALPDDLGPFDAVFSSEVLQHVPTAAQRLAALRGFRRVLRPGGRCVVSVLAWNRRVRSPRDGFWESGIYCHYTTPAELGALLAQAGFARVSLHGMLILPGVVARRLPPAWAALEPRLSMIGALAGAGRFVVGVGRA